MAQSIMALSTRFDRGETYHAVAANDQKYIEAAVFDAGPLVAVSG